MADPGLPLTTGEGNTAAQFHIRREHLLEGSALDVDPPFASLDVVLWRDYEAECGRLREQVDAWKDKAFDALAFSKRANDNCVSLSEQLDAARQALERIDQAVTFHAAVHDSRRTTSQQVVDLVSEIRAVLGVEGPAE